METFVVYGFEYENKMWFNKGLTLCKSLISGNPIYCSIIIQKNRIEDAYTEIKECEENKKEDIENVNKMASLKYCNPSWQLAYYATELKFDCGYESEGDENGDGR